MKPVDPQDKPKLIVLSVLSAGVFGYGLLQLGSGLAGAAPSPVAKKPVVVQGVAASAGDASANTVSAPTDSESVVPDPSAGDPFLPKFVTEAAPAGAVPSSVAAVGGGAGQPLPVLPDSVLASIGRPGKPPVSLPGPKSGAVEGADPAVAPVEVGPPPPPSLHVAGLLVAEPGSDGRSVAILAGSGEKRYVTAGDPVGNGYVVASVSLKGVEVVDPNNRGRRFTFSLPKR
jgi:hypothetical protein